MKAIPGLKQSRVWDQDQVEVTALRDGFPENRAIEKQLGVMDFHSNPVWLSASL